MPFDGRGLVVAGLLLPFGIAFADLPLTPSRTIEFETTEGTWMSTSVSPDGRTLVFDLLGDLYTVGSDGGDASAITDGLAFDSQPVFSPDGERILFVSDRSGAENLWVADANGASLRQVSWNTTDRMLASPAWSADGIRVYGSVFRADLNSYELWSFVVDGNGKGELLIPVKSSADQARTTWVGALGAAPSPDGRYVYYAHHSGELAEDTQRWTIRRLDLETGDSEVVVEPADTRGNGFPGSYFRPGISPDGRYLVYGSRHRGRTGLRIRRLADGSDRWLAYPVQRDQLHATSVQDLLPGYAFTPDGRSIVLAYDGGIHRHSLEGDRVSDIPFRADVRLELGPELRVDILQDTGPVRARLIQHPVQSPDGRRLAFSALGRIYVQALGSDAAPTRLVDLPPGQFHPSWAPDGDVIAFVTWSTTGGGHVWTVRVDGDAPPVRRTDVPDFYTNPAFSPDGKTILALRSRHDDRMNRYMEYGVLRDAELIAIPRAGGGVRAVVSGNMGGRPHFVEDSDTAVLAFDDGLEAVDIESGERRVIVGAVGHGWYFAEGPGRIHELAISPDGRRVLAKTAAQQLHVFPVPDDPGTTVDLADAETGHRQLTSVGADFFAWADGGRMATWALGSTFFRCRLEDAGCGEIERFDIAVEVPRDAPQGELVLRGATVLTMRDGEVVERADIHIRSDRIGAVVPYGSIDVQPDADVIRIDGTFVVPGFIDAHNHVADIRRDVLAMSSWGAAADLVYGVTTSFDPSSLSIDMLAYEDLVDAGIVIGSRIRSTGPAIFSFHDFRSFAEVEDVLRRYRDFYRTRNIKMYRTGNRRVRQWVAMAARDVRVMPTTEGALAMKLGITQVLDGFSGLEHELAALPPQHDVVELMARSGVSYTPTLVISAGPDAKDYFITRRNPANDPKLNRFWPATAVDRKLRQAPWHALEEYSFPQAAAGAAEILRAGGLVAVGSHGNVPGLGFHWEMQALAMGGMRPTEVLLAATLNSARAIGRGREFGSIEAGKYADLVVLEGDPRDDIANTLAIRYVMKNGRLYDAETLDEVWPRQRPFPKRWPSNNGEEGDEQT